MAGTTGGSVASRGRSVGPTSRRPAPPRSGSSEPTTWQQAPVPWTSTAITPRIFDKPGGGLPKMTSTERGHGKARGLSNLRPSTIEGAT